MSRKLRNRAVDLSPQPQKGRNKLAKLKQKVARDEKPNLEKREGQRTISNHPLAKVKKQVSISSESFVICKATDFENDYEVVGKLGEGSFGSVFRVKHRTLGLERALKKIKKNPGAQFSTFEEIEILKKLDHSNILKIYEFYETEEYYMIVTDIFEGRELFDQIIDANKISEDIAVRVIREVLKTLCYTHGLGIAHRDIKPENILVKHISDESKFKMKIIDWGLGTLIQEGLSDRVCGTPEYAAPQVFQGKYSVLCDMWSLGILCFIMMTGNMPFKGSNTQDTITQVKRCIINYRKSGFNDLSQNAKEFITALIQKEPGKRMTAAKALEHPWITQYQQLKQEPQNLQPTLVRLKELTLTNHFGVAVVNLINNHFSSSQEKEKLQEIFKFLDSNGDGVLSSQELVQGYTRIYGRTLAEQIALETFSKLDVNHSGTLEFSEFIAYGLRREKEKGKEKLKYAFDMFDKDKNGLISWKEVANIFEGKLDSFYEQEMKELLEEVKSNGENEINFDNFYKFMEGLLERVDVIRESRKKESMIKSEEKKRFITRNEPVNMNLKRTESIDEVIKPEKEAKIETSPLKKKKQK